MPWSRTKNGDWLVDYDALYAVFRGAEFARLSHHYTDIESKQSWWGPKTYNAVTDLERVKREVNASAHRKFEHFKPILNDKPETAFRLLANMMDQARYDRNRLKEKRQRALTSTMQNISASVDTYENRIAWAKFTQKTSLIALTILPTMGTSAVGATGFWAASTGVRMTAVAGTAGLQGYSTYQNSTNTSHPANARSSPAN